MEVLNIYFCMETDFLINYCWYKVFLSHSLPLSPSLRDQDEAENHRLFNSIMASWPSSMVMF